VGLIICSLPSPGSEVIRTLRENARDLGGSLNVMSAPPQLEALLSPWDDPGPSLELMRRLRDAYDPLRVINPGRHIADG
jgi:FAD/FMN-containing dehydrogenase